MYNERQRPKLRSAGITLIELMVVVAIVAILGAIAYPSYRQHVIRANRTEAKVALLERAQVYEKCYTRWHTYVPCAVAGGSTPGGLYSIAAVTGPGGQTYTITATPQAAQQADTACGVLRIDERGVRGHTGSGSVRECW